MSFHSLSTATTGKGSPRRGDTTSTTNYPNPVYNSNSNNTTATPNPNYGTHPASRIRPNYALGPSSSSSSQQQKPASSSSSPSSLFSPLPTDPTRVLQKMGRLGDKAKEFKADREHRKWVVEAGLDVKREGRLAGLMRATGRGVGKAEGKGNGEGDGQGWVRDGSFER